MNLGNAYLKQNRLKDTLKAFEQALKCNPPAADRTFLVNDINDIHRVMRNLGQEPMPDPNAGKSKKSTAKSSAGAAKTVRTQPPKPAAKPQKEWGYE